MTEAFKVASVTEAFKASTQLDLSVARVANTSKQQAEPHAPVISSVATRLVTSLYHCCLASRLDEHHD